MSSQRGTAQASTPALTSHGADAHVHTARTEIRTAPALSRERKLVARDFDDALDAEGVENTALADGYYQTSESVVRRLRTGEKPLGLFHLLVGPVDVFRRVLVSATVRALGKTGALAFFAECVTSVAKGDR